MLVGDQDRKAVEEAARDAGLEVEEVRERSSGGAHQVTVVVDRDGGVDLDSLAALSRALDLLAEGWGPADETVTLDVTSRGVDAPLTGPRHWRRAFGRTVELQWADGASGPEAARVGACDESAGTVRLVHRRGRGLVADSVALSSVASAVVRPEFRPVPPAELDLLGPPPTALGPGLTREGN